jgi:hypothetical protein
MRRLSRFLGYTFTAAVLLSAAYMLLYIVIAVIDDNQAHSWTASVFRWIYYFPYACADALVAGIVVAALLTGIEAARERVRKPN